MSRSTKSLAVVKQLVALTEAGRVKPSVLDALLEGKRIELLFGRGESGLYDGEMINAGGIKHTLNPPDLMGARVYAAPKPEARPTTTPVKAPGPPSVRGGGDGNPGGVSTTGK